MSSTQVEKEALNPNYVFSALVHAALLTAYHTFGFYYAVYGIIIFLFIPAIVIMLANVVLSNADLFTSHMKEGKHRKINRSLILQFFTQIITSASIYTVYLAGFTFLAGFFTFFIIAAFMGTFFLLISGKQE